MWLGHILQIYKINDSVLLIWRSMMRRTALILTFLTLWIVSGSTFISSRIVYATDCCMCGKCLRGCFCPGIGGCPYCAGPELQSAQINPGSKGLDSINIRQSGTSFRSAIVRLDTNSERLIRLAENQCTSFAMTKLRLPDEGGFIRAFVLTGDNDNKGMLSTVAFQIADINR